MSIALLAAVVLTVLGVGYTLYGRVVARVMGLNPENPTPANTVNDGVDFVPTRKFYLLGQHFSAIAAAGPIAGPILACQQFGWFPSILWIALGVVFIGAVHDFSSLIASVRHGAKSIAELMREHVSRRAWRAMMTFIWVALIYVIVAFTDITASTFVGITQEFPLDNVTFNAGGAVALASTLYLLLAVLMGHPETLESAALDPDRDLRSRHLRPGLAEHQGFDPVCFRHDQSGKDVGLADFDLLFRGFAGAGVDSAPTAGLPGRFHPLRGTRGGSDRHVLRRFQRRPGVVQDLERNGKRRLGVPLFPFLFVTIACGACSGFHGLVCSGTTSKQISTEPDCKPVGYGAMLLEAFVALIALATIMIATPAQTKGVAPGTIYGNGIGRFLTVLIGEENRLFAITFGAMAFSTFVFDTLDVGTRLGRYILQELFNWTGKTGMILGTAVTLLPAYIFIATAERGAYLKYWTLFGTSNQLLAALTLLAITRWLMKTGRNYWITLAPMLFVLTVTLWALILQFTNFSRVVMDKGFVAAGSTTINAIAAFLLLLMTAIILWEARRSLGGQGKLQLEGARP